MHDLLTALRLRLVLALAVTWILVSSASALLAAGQTGSGWTEPQAISLPDEHGAMPTLAVDASGVVHAFWSTRPVDREDAPWAIAYARLEDGVWTRPVDIFLSPNGKDALFPRAVVDSGGRLHLVWSAQGWAGIFGPLYYSSAPAQYAGTIRAWQPIDELADGTYQSDLRLSSDGVLRLVYASVTDARGICHLATLDRGERWTAAACIERSYELRDEEHEVQPRLAIDSHNTLHVVWTLDDYSRLNRLGYYSRAVYYAHSRDGGQSWSLPVAMDIVDGRDPAYHGRQPAWANIVVDAQDRVHIVYVGAPDMQRYHTYSEDGGMTWSRRQVAIPSGGYNNWQGVAVDSAGVLHLVWPSLRGLEYTTWSNGVWAPVSPVAEQQRVGGAHDAQAVVALGNLLHVAWQDHGGDISSNKVGHILYARLMTGATAEPSDNKANHTGRWALIAGADMSDIADRVRKIVVEHLGVEEDKVVDSASFIDDLGADSLDTVELVMAFEEEFGIEIPDDAAESIQTFGDAVKFISEKAA